MESPLSFPETVWALKVWILIGVAVTIVLLALGDWLLTGWITNVLRNYLDAKRRRRRKAN